MKRTILVLLAILTVSLFGSASAQAAFGLKELVTSYTDSEGVPSMQAGSHPFALTTSFATNTEPYPYQPFVVPQGSLKDVNAITPAGLIGKPTAVPRCSTADFYVSKVGGGGGLCADATAIGITETEVLGPGDPFTSPVYNLEPPPGVAAQIGFWTLIEPVTIDLIVNPDPPYNVIARAHHVPQVAPLYSSKVELWGVPADPRHNADRGNCADLEHAICPVNIPVEPFLTMPSSCTGPLATRFEATSWEGDSFAETIEVAPGAVGCGKLGFSPEITSQATSRSAETGSGLDFDVDIKDEGLTAPNGVAQSTIKRAEVILPKGVTVNPSIAEGLGVCTPADLGRESLSSAPGQGCPNAAKIGEVRVDTPLLDKPVEGSVYIAQQDDPATPAPGAENPFDSLLAMYIVLRNPTLGILVKLAARIEPDPATGQLVTTLEDIPQLPFSHFSFHFREGARAPLVTPPNCGEYTTRALFTPAANPAATRTVTSSFKITSGVGGAPCPAAGAPPFRPAFEAGAVNNSAGSFSPFTMRLTRADGEQDMTRFSAALPPGQLGSLAGVGRCPDGAIALARAKSGRQELAAPSCPASSQIGHTLAGAGVGGALTYVKGAIYLSGPYKGDPLSVVAITPAVAGPFDAGTVAVRLGLTLNPKSAEVEVDGATSDPIPHILKGIVLKLRDLRVFVDRPRFTLNPTSCDESSTRATLFGSNLDVFNPADDVPAALSSRYQAANCLNLGFKPRLALRLHGGTKRGQFPAFSALYTPRPGDANLKGLVVRLPHSAFLEQGHIRTVCTRVQFAAQACPKGAQYGYIKAWTPLLEEPLQGPVYLRSSSHPLPDLVFDLQGLVDIEVATRIDSVQGGIRATITDSPDAPISKVLLRMQGAKKGLIVNSRNLCAGSRSRAKVALSAHNGMGTGAKTVLRASCSKPRGQKK